MSDCIVELSVDDFNDIKEELKCALSEQLTEEIELAEFDAVQGEDLWDTPGVDSKTMIKLSPIVEEYTGRKLDTEWLKPGGYESVEEAVEHLIEQLELDFSKSEKENDNC